MERLRSSIVLLPILTVAAAVFALVLNPHLQALVLANLGYGTALFAAILAPAWLVSVWYYFSQGRPFHFLLLYFSALTAFFLAAGEPDILNVLFSLLQGKLSPLFRSQFIFALLAVTGIGTFFYFGYFFVYGHSHPRRPLRFVAFSFLYLSYMALAVHSISRLFVRV